MKVLAIDVGSSSVKMGIVRAGRLSGRMVRAAFATHYAGERAEVHPDDVFHAIGEAARGLGASSRRIDLIAVTGMSPSWVAMDKRGRPLTPIVTHQDRRSTEIAIELERCVGKRRHLKLAGNRPIPGGISSTTCAWFLRHEPALMRRADLIGHVQTLLHRRFCDARVVDPSNASFMGLYSTLTLGGWNDELCDTVGVSKQVLPEIREANAQAGTLAPDAARLLGLPRGVPVLVGMMDTGAAMLLAGARAGQLVNVIGSTDVLALCTQRPRPHERLLMRGLGVGKKWLSVGTIGAAGSSLTWARKQLFADLSKDRFFALVDELASAPIDATGPIRFDPYLAGDRCAVEQRRAAFNGLTLSATRQQMLKAVIEALARQGAERIGLLKETGTPLRRRVMISGGAGNLAALMHRDWPGNWRFWEEEEATMRGLAGLAGE